MSDKSRIEWTDATWNPIRGTKGRWSCVKVSPGCLNCYAETMNVRLGGPLYLPGADELHLERTLLKAPLTWRRPRRVFVCSMTDLFEDRVPTDWIDSVFAVMALARQHTFQVLTKRPQRMRDYLLGFRFGEINEAARAASGRDDVAVLPTQAHGMVETRWPLPNVWLGVSVENQKYADRRVLPLLQTPAAVRFVSAEPLLGPIEGIPMRRWCTGHGLSEGCCRGLDWVIVGGESGPGERPCDLDWIRDIRDQCRASGVAVFVKQLGASPFEDLSPPGPARIARRYGVGPLVAKCYKLRDRKGGDPAEWPEDLRVREWPTLSSTH